MKMKNTNGTAMTVVADGLVGVGLEVSEVLYGLGDMLRGWAEDGEGAEAADVLERLLAGVSDTLAFAQRFAPDLTTREVYAAAVAVVGALPMGPGVQAELSDAVRLQWERDIDLTRMARAG